VTQQFTATAIYSDGTKGNVTASVTWDSSDQMVLDISATSGLAMALAPGTSIVSAHLGMVTASTAVTVTSAMLTSINVQPVAATVPRGTSQSFTATASYADGTTADVTTSVVWSVGDERIATVSNGAGTQGQATGLMEGGTVVTATLSGVVGAAKLAVTNATVVSISVTPKASTIAVGARSQLTATATFSDMTMRDVTDMATWSVSDPSIAGVSTSTGTAGLTTGMKIGTVEVTASYSASPTSSRSPSAARRWPRSRSPRQC
jgi:hypothetical protein